MHIEKRDENGKIKYFLSHSYREGKKVHKFRKYLGQDLKPEKLNERKIIADLWDDLQNAYKFGSLVRLEEKLNLKWFGTRKVYNDGQLSFIEFDQKNLDDFESFRNSFFSNLQKAVAQNTAKQGQSFLNIKTQDAITYLQILTQKYDIAAANPP